MLGRQRNYINLLEKPSNNEAKIKDKRGIFKELIKNEII